MSHGCIEGIARTSKRHEEGIALRINFMAPPAVEARPQQVSALREDQSVALAQLLQQARRSLDVSEEQRDGSRR